MTTNENISTTKIDFKHLLKSGGMAAVGGTIGNLLVFFIASALGASFEVPEQGAVLMIHVIMASVNGVLGAMVVYAILERFTQNAPKIFLVIALVFLLITLVPPITSGADTGTIVAFIIMHIISGVLCIWLIPKRE